MSDEIKEELKDVVAEFKARLHSPLFGSFIIAWLCINWYIPVALVFYKQSDLCLDGYSSYKELIWANSNWWNTVLIPLPVALLYTFAYPYLRAFITEHLTKVDTKSGNKIVEITALKISHQKIIDGLKREYNLIVELRQKDEEKLGELEQTVNTSKNLNTALDKQFKDSQRELSYQVSEKKVNKELNDTTFFNGLWDVKYFADLGHENQRWNISMDKIYWISGKSSEAIGTIHNNVYFEGTMVLTYQVFNSSVYQTFNMVISQNHKSMVGIDGYGRQVTFTRIEA